MSKFTKLSEKMIKGMWVFTRGKRIWVNLPGQQLGQSCHKISDIMNPGRTIERVVHDDPGPPDDLDYVEDRQEARV